MNLLLAFLLFFPFFATERPEGNVVVNAGEVFTAATANGRFVASQRGKIWLDGRLYLDMSYAVVQDGERGLTGLAWTDTLYVLYVDRDQQMTLGRIADRVLTLVRQFGPAADRHSTAALSAGPDLSLYIGIGENGDPLLYGRILRLSQFDSLSIFASGFRNPWGMRWQDGNLIVADVGEGRREEANLVVQGQHYGWPCFEGELPYVYDPDRCLSLRHTLPIGQYDHGLGNAIINTVVVSGRLLAIDITGNVIDLASRQVVHRLPHPVTFAQAVPDGFLIGGYGFVRFSRTLS